MKNRKLLLIISVVLALTMSLGGTLAYLTDTDADVNTMVLGNVQIVQNEQERRADGSLDEFTQDKPLLPAVYTGDSIPWADEANWPGEGEAWKVVEDNVNVLDKFVTVTNKGNTPAFVRTLIAYEGDATTNNCIHVVANGTNVDPDIDVKWFENVEIKGVTYCVGVYTYPEALGAKETTIPSLKQIYLDKTANNDTVASFGEKYDILVISQAVQASGFTGAAEALNAGFNNGEALSAEKIVEWFEELYNADGTINQDMIGSPSDDGENDKNDTNNPPEFTSPVDTWDGTSDPSWYNDTDTEFVITTAEQLAGLAELVDGGNTFEGKTVKLGKNIDLYALNDKGEKISFDPIGYGYNIVFKGTFDGQGHTIDNLYQNGWALGYDYSTAGGGLFASVVDATIKNLTLDNAEIVMECIDMGMLVGYSYGNCTYENIAVKNSSIANYQRYTGGVVGEVNGKQTFKNVDVIDTTVASMWGDFDCSLGGIIGGKYGEAEVYMEDCDVECVLDTHNDVISAYQWYAYRRGGMLIGNSEETVKDGDRTSASASYLTAKNCTVTYGDWVNYHYCEFAGTNYPYVRVEAGLHNEAYSNPRYGHPTDANGNKVVDDNHVHNEGEDHNILLTFDQLFGGGQGVYGGATHEGVTVIYNNK